MNRIAAIIGIAAAAAPALVEAQAQNGGSATAAPCAACHGARGEGDAPHGAPRLAGQSMYYLSRQLRAYVDGSRKNPIMSPIAESLSDAQRESLAAYYAAQEAPAVKQPSLDAAKLNITRAERLAKAGDEKLHVQACENCHGPGGIGEPPVFPYVAGQIGQYLQTTLTDWKSGARNTDPSRQMQMIAQRLSAADIAAVSGYYARQAPPRLRDLEAAAQGSAGSAPSAGSTRPGIGNQPAQGGGSEGGAPTTGGSQGPGGGGGASGSGPSGGSGGTQ